MGWRYQPHATGQSHALMPSEELQGGRHTAFHLTSFSFPAHIHFLDLCAGPRSFTQKRQTGLDTWVVGETPNRDPAAHFLPAIFRDERGQNRFQRYAVKWVVGGMHARAK